MIEIPLTAAIIMIGLIFLQSNHYRFLHEENKQPEIEIDLKEWDEIKKGFDEYKRRVDSLTLRAGFIK